jgi:hypothetical protein
VSSEDLQRFTPESIREYVRALARIELSLAEAAELVPLVRGQKAALARLERFEVDNVRPSAGFDPRSPYGPSDRIGTLQ